MNLAFQRSKNYCKKHLLCLLLLLWVSFQGLQAQDHYDRLTIKDLQAEFASSNDVERRTLVLYDVCLYYQVKDYQVDSVVYYAQKLLTFAQEYDHPPAAVLGHRMLGSQYARINRFEEAKVHLYKSIALAKANNYLRYIHDSYNPLGRTYAQEHKLDSALYYYNKCLETAPSNLYSKHSNFHMGIADVYQELGRVDEHEKHLLLSYENAVAAKINLDQLISLTYLLDFYSATVRDAVLFNKYKKKYDVVAATYGDPLESYHANFIFLDSIDHQDKIVFLESVLSDNMKTHYLDGVFINFLQLQNEHLKKKDYKKAAEVSDRAIAYYEQGNTIRLALLVDIYENKWLAESKLADPRRAFETIKIYQDLKDSLVEIKNAKHVNELSIKYESAQKDAQIADALIRTNNRTAQRNYALLVSVALLTLGFLVWRRSRYKQLQAEAENRLQAEKIISLEKERKILSLASMIEGQEVERTRIAQDLHDGLGGLLSAVRNHFSLIQVEVKKLDRLNVYDRTNAMIDQACNEVRRISHNLMPASLQLNGLIPTIQQYCADVETSKKIMVQFEHSPIVDQRLDETKEIFIYRIVQEAVTNVLKHAQAENLLVQLNIYEREIILIIEDDGVGFDLSADSQGIGLQSIRSRVDHLKGQIDIDSRMGSGTTITINIPYEY